MQWGIKSPEHWLAWQTGLSPTRAKQMVDTARRAAELPATFAAFADGELSVDQVATVAKHAKAHNDAEVCQIAKSATVTQLRNALSRYVHTDRRVPDEPVPVAVEGGDPCDYVSTNFDDHGRFALHLSAPTDRGAIISKALAEARDALIHAGQKDVTWLDAFVEVCNRSLDSITSRSRRDRFRIYMHLNTDDPGGPAGAWLNGGPTLPDAIRDVLCCDGVVQPLWHTGGLPVNVGRARYIVPPHTRRCVLDRDRTCRHPSVFVHHVLGGAPHRRLAEGRPHRHVQPGRAVPKASRRIPPRRVPNVRQPRHPRPASLLRRPRAANPQRRCAQRANGPTTGATTGQAICAPHRRTLRHPLARLHPRTGSRRLSDFSRHCRAASAKAYLHRWSPPIVLPEPEWQTNA